VKALDRKLLRDLRLMWSQALTIALVVASGIGGFVTSLSAVDSLALARVLLSISFDTKENIMKKTSRRNFGKQLTGAIAAVSVGSLTVPCARTRCSEP